MDSNDLRLDLYIEALIFSAEYALSVEEIKKSLHKTFDQSFEDEEVLHSIEVIKEKFDSPRLAIQLCMIAGGYIFMTKPEFYKIIENFLRLNEKKKLSKAAMETLSIIAYKQPITKIEIESIRGVNSDYTVQKLLEKELVEIYGRREGPGRPLEYCTTIKFLDHFGIKDSSDLPKLKELEPLDNSIGESAPADTTYEKSVS